MLTMLKDVPVIDVTPMLRYKCGVYFLVDNDIIVYVGQTINHPITRLSGHKGKIFDRILFLPVPRPFLTQVENDWIEALQPRYNITGTLKSSEVYKLREVTKAVRQSSTPKTKKRAPKLLYNKVVGLTQWTKFQND